MRSGHFFTHCRTHVKAWISLVVIVQCLVLILYLIVVSDKETTQQPPLGRQNHMVTLDTKFLRKEEGSRPSKRRQVTALNRTNGRSEYPIKHFITHATAHKQDHLNKNSNLKEANEVLFRKIGSKREKQKVVNRRDEILKKSLLHQARWAEKAERHKKQKLKGIKSRNIVNNTSKDGASNFPQFDIRVIRADKNEAVKSRMSSTTTKTIGRELKKFKSDSTVESKDNTIKSSNKIIVGSQSQSLVRRIDSVVKEKLSTKGLTSENSKAKREEHFNVPETKNNSFKLDKLLNVANVSKNYNLTTISIANLSLYTDFVSIPRVFHLDKVLPTAEYFETRRTKYSTYQCYKPGTRPQIGPEDFLCSCEKGWHGRWCSFPDSLYYSAASQFFDQLSPRKYRRRIINAIPFNVEWELLEARLHELNDTVDLFILMESNYTMYGDHKPLRLLERFSQGYLREYHHKILYLFLDHFPEGGKEDGWIEDHYIRTFLSQESVKRISGLNPDDLFISTDTDEIPTNSALQFLALHDGYPEPFGFALRWSVFGFFWRQFDATKIFTGCTIRMLHEVFHDDIYVLRTQEYHDKYTADITTYIKRGGNVSDWILGDNGVYAGWHCSWCLSPDRIRTKLTSAINADFPRWGDYPDKLDLDYIRKLVKSGTWFDDTTKFGALVHVDRDPHFAPKYLIDNFENYKILLDITAV